MNELASALRLGRLSIVSYGSETVLLFLFTLFLNGRTIVKR